LGRATAAASWCIGTATSTTSEAAAAALEVATTTLGLAATSTAAGATTRSKWHTWLGTTLLDNNTVGADLVGVGVNGSFVGLWGLEIYESAVLRTS